MAASRPAAIKGKTVIAVARTRVERHIANSVVGLMLSHAPITWHPPPPAGSPDWGRLCDGHIHLCWDEPTSFFAFSSAYAIDVVALACKLAIAPSADMFLIREIDRQEARVCGLVLNRTIFKPFPI
jgi:hypothetical protein